MLNSNSTKNKRNSIALFISLLLVQAFPIIAQNDTTFLGQQSKYVLPAHVNNLNISFYPIVLGHNENEEKLSVEIKEVQDLSYIAVVKHSWEIVKENTRVAYKELDAEPKAISLSSLFGDVFAPCSDYEIRLKVYFSLGNTSSAERKISTHPVVKAGWEEKICETLFPYTLKKFKPFPEKGFGTGLQQGFWTSNSDELRVSENGIITLRDSFQYDRVHKLTYHYRDRYGCLAKEEENMFVTPVPKNPVVYIKGPVRKENPLVLDCKNEEYGNHLWTGPENFTYQWSSTCMRRDYAPEANGLYTVKIEWNGCTGPEDSIEVKPSPEKPVNCPASDQVLSITEAMQYERVGCLLSVKGFFHGHDPHGIEDKLVRKDYSLFFVGASPAGSLSEEWSRDGYLCYVRTDKVKKIQNLRWDQALVLKGKPEVTNHEGWNEMSFFVEEIE